MKQAVAEAPPTFASLPGTGAAGLRSTSRLVSAGVALAVTAGFCSSAKGGPLPQLAGAAAFLLLAIEQDVRRLRIPNWLTFPALAGALALAFATAGFPGLGSALAGAGVTFGLLFPAYCLRWLGAGDVKAAMVLAALFGTHVFLSMLWWMVLAGGLLGLVLLVTGGGLRDLLGRWWQSAKLTLLLRRPTYVQPAPGSAAARGLPFAVAMGVGATAFQLWGVPW